MRNPIPFDTHAYVKRLIAAGVPEPQAEVHAQAFVEVVIEQLATKEDVARLGQDLRAEMQAEFQKQRGEFQAALKDLELRLTIRMGAMMAAAVAAMAALVKLMG